MNNIYQHYIIDLSSNNNFVQIPTVQGDGNNIRGFEVELIENGVQYEIDKNDCLVAIMGTKPDTSQIMNDCTVSDEGYILVDITSQMSAVKGRGDYQIVLMSRRTNSQLKSFLFHILTTPAAFDIDYIVSSDEFQALTRNIVRTEEVIEETNDAISDMRALESSVEKAEKARVDAEEKRVSAENIRIKNEDIRQNNETIRQDNETVRQSNETMRESSEDTRRSNEFDRQIAETARISAETDRVNAEDFRETNEDIRIGNENARKAEETKRDDAENIRIDNESVRQTNESIRETNESNRQTNTATAISNAEKATDNANAAAEKARVAGEKATAAETTAIEKAAEAGNYAKMAQSYAVGTGEVRPDESTDNAKYYSEQSKSYADSWKGSLLPKGTISFSQLPTSDNVAGHMYNISDAFETDSRFKDGAGYAYAAGTNVYWTADEKWDCLSGAITMELTMAEYNALSDAQKMNGTIYYISDADNSIPSATENFDGLMSHADKQKLDGIEEGANAYSLPLASESVRGGVKIGYTQNGNNYPVQLNDDEQMYVNVNLTPEDIGAATSNNSHDNTYKITFSASEPTNVAEGEIVMVYDSAGGEKKKVLSIWINGNVVYGGETGDETGNDEQHLEPGLYDANNVMLASWDELVHNYGLDVTQNRTSSSKLILNYIMSENTNLNNGTKLVIGNVDCIGDYIFFNCENLTSIEIPKSVTSIGTYAFAGCSALTSIEIPDGVTSIKAYAFRSCTNIKTIFIPESVLTVSNYLFLNCFKLKIYCETSSKPSGWSSNYNDHNLYNDKLSVTWNVTREVYESTYKQ